MTEDIKIPTYIIESEMERTGKTIWMLDYTIESEIINFINCDSSYMREATAVTFFDKIDQFFKNIISAIKRFGEKIKTTMDANIRTSEMKKNLRALYLKAEEMKREGKTSIEMADYEEMERVVTRYIGSLQKLAKRIVTNEYKKTEAMDADFKEFLRIYDEAEQKFLQASEKTVQVPVEKAIRWAEQQINGRDNTLTVIDETVRCIEELENEVKRMQDKREIYGADILPAKMSILRRITTKLSRFSHEVVGKRASKIIANIVFFCA